MEDKKTLLICGAGQYGLVVKEIALAMGVFSKIDFLDDNSDIAIGKFCDINNIVYDEAIVAVGDVKVRKRIFSGIKKHSTIIHPMAIVMPSACIQEGTVIEAGAVVSSGAIVGCGSIVMSNAVVGHDARVGDFCQLKYASVIPERTVVPSCTKVECGVVFEG